MKQSLVADALVGFEIILLHGQHEGERERGEAPIPSLTVDKIVDKYELDWGTYLHERDHDDPMDDEVTAPRHQNRAKQLVRNALNRAYQRKLVARLRRVGDNLLVREGKAVVYVDPESGEHPVGTFVEFYSEDEEEAA